MSLPLVLASTSPRRQELLRAVGLPFELFAPDVDESASGLPQDMVCELSRRKARAAAAKMPGRLIVAADTLVYAQGQTLGKPADEADARRMLKLLSGREHQVFTGLCLIDGQSGREMCLVDETSVTFDPMDEEEIADYIASGEPYGKAGAYAVQGRAGQYVSRLNGSYSNVVGLPLHLLRHMLKALNITD